MITTRDETQPRSRVIENAPDEMPHDDDDDEPAWFTTMLCSDPTVSGVLLLLKNALRNLNIFVGSLNYIIIGCVLFAVAYASVGGMLFYAFTKRTDKLLARMLRVIEQSQFRCGLP